MIRKREIAPACEGFKKISMPKIEDKDFRNRLIAIHLYLLKERRKYQQDADDLRTALLNPLQERIDEVQRLARQFDGEADAQKRLEIRAKINAFTDVDEAQVAYRKALDKLGRETIEVDAIPQDKFVEEYMEQGYNAEVVEQLFPLFAEAPEKK